MNFPFSPSRIGSGTRPGSRGGLLGLLLLLCCLPQLHGQTNFLTLVTNGPASNRLNVVFFSEGYISNQFGQFLMDATNAANSLSASAPFAEYRTYCNFYAIAVASLESGSDHPVSMISRNTYFNSTFGPSDYLMSIPTNSTGQGKVDALLNTYMPACDLAVLLVNDPNIGGSDGGGRTAIVAASFASPDILLHECGHVLAGLGDEYSDDNPGFPDIEEPNTTRQTNRAAIKWNAWISTETPVPTPPTGPYANFVGLFEGAHYHATGWYRPRINCRMNSFFTSFYCEVCSEALVLSIYRQARPIDSFTPTATNLSVTTSAAINFALTLLQPASHVLNVQWLTNGAPVAGATNTTFSILPAALGNGMSMVTSRVIDATPLVRTDTSNLLSHTRTWSITVSLPQLQLSEPHWLGGGKFAVHVAGVAPQGFSIQASTNLVNWLGVSTNSLVNGQYDYTNTQGTSFPIRFFRAVTPP